MSLVNTLAKAAIGIAIAKGLGHVVSGDTRRGRADPRRGVGHGTPYSGSVSHGSTRGGSDELTTALGNMLGGRGARGRGSLGAALEDLSRLSTQGHSGPSSSPRQDTSLAKPRPGSFGDLLDQSLARYGEPDTAPTRDQEEFAALLLRALIQAAKADGQIDPGERRQLTEHLGDLDRAELEFVDKELAKPIDVAGLARDVPKDAFMQVYIMSLMGIDLDTRKEAAYLHQLARAFGLDPPMVNAIHDRLGEPRIFP